MDSVVRVFDQEPAVSVGETVGRAREFFRSRCVANSAVLADGGGPAVWRVVESTDVAVVIEPVISAVARGTIVPPRVRISDPVFVGSRLADFRIDDDPLSDRLRVFRGPGGETAWASAHIRRSLFQLPIASAGVVFDGVKPSRGRRLEPDVWCTTSSGVDLELFPSSGAFGLSGGRWLAACSPPRGAVVSVVEITGVRVTGIGPVPIELEPSDVFEPGLATSFDVVGGESATLIARVVRDLLPNSSLDVLAEVEASAAALVGEPFPTDVDAVRAAVRRAAVLLRHLDG